MYIMFLHYISLNHKHSSGWGYRYIFCNDFWIFILYMRILQHTKSCIITTHNTRQKSCKPAISSLQRIFALETIIIKHQNQKIKKRLPLCGGKKKIEKRKKVHNTFHSFVNRYEQQEMWHSSTADYSYLHFLN